MSDKIIFHIDVNSAYLSWEATYRKALGIDSVDLRTIPSIVGGDVKKRKGIVLAKSVSAKQYGIFTGESVYSAFKKCPHLTVVSPTYGLYQKASACFVNLLREYSSCVEQYSVDECFLDYTQSIRLLGDPLKTADEIRRRMKDELGFSVNVGISHNKLLAKMASELKKPDRTHTLFQNEIQTKMWTLDVSELFMVGRHTAMHLRELGIHTIGELAQADTAFLMRTFQPVRGWMLHNYANGIDGSEVRSVCARPKSIGNSTTLPRDVSRKEDIHPVLLSLCEAVGRRLRSKSLEGDVITFGMKNSSFRYRSTRCKIPYPTNCTKTIFQTARMLLARSWNEEAIRHVGVTVSNLTETNSSQLSFFAGDARQKQMEQAVDKIREQYGNASIIKASLLGKHVPVMGGVTGNEIHFSMTDSVS